ncbi:MAG TPA: peptidoglycan-binding protein, partial [Chitinophagaceae bacterium]
MAVAVSLTACQQIAGYFNNESSDSAKLATDQNLIVERDLSINQSNSYSDLFLDSTAVENYISKNNLSDTLAREMRNFYNGRNLQFAWMSSAGLTEQGRGFWSLADRIGTKEDAFGTRMDSLASEDSIQIQASDSSYAQTELKLTEQFLKYKDSLSGKASFATNIFIPAKKQDVLALADSLLKTPVDTNNTNPSVKQYAKLQEYLRKYRELATGDTSQTNISTRIKKGSSSAEVAALKRYLYLTGDYATHDTTQVYNDSLNKAIRSYQKRHGLKEDGVISDSIAKMMNVSAEERMQQIIINMN